MLNISSPRLHSAIRLGIVAFIAASILAVLLLACVPPVSRDALTHHLAIPKLYLERGAIYEIPDCVFSYYPMNLDLLYLIPLSWGNDILPKYIHFSFALFTAVLLFYYLKKKLNTTYGLLGALLFLSIPVIIKLSITVYVDLGLIFFSTAALLAFIRWKETGYQSGFLIVSAICCGLALGTKYNGLITFFLITLFVPFAFAADNNNGGGHSYRAVLPAIIFIMVSLIVYSPWLLKNYLWTNNPLYPLFNNFFQGQAVNLVPDPARLKGSGTLPALNHFSLRAGAYGESLLEIASIPIRVFFQGQDNNPKYFDGILNPYLFLLPLAWVWSSGKKALDPKTAEFYLLTFSVFYLFFVFFKEDMRIRWIAPIIPPLVILSVQGLHAVIDRISRHLGGKPRSVGLLITGLVVAILLGLNFNYLGNQFKEVAPWGYISGAVARDDYIARYRQAYPVHKFASENLPEDTRILGLFLGNRRYYSDRALVFKNSLPGAVTTPSESNPDIGSALRKKEFSHILLRKSLFEKWTADNLNRRELIRLQGFFDRQLRLLSSNGDYLLFAICALESGTSQVIRAP